MDWSQPMAYITSKEISKFILNYIICQYGVPLSIVIDNECPFKNQDVRELCEKYHIQHHYATQYYPQGNGQVEASNITIVKILKNIIDDFGQD